MGKQLASKFNVKYIENTPGEFVKPLNVRGSSSFFPMSGVWF